MQCNRAVVGRRLLKVLCLLRRKPVLPHPYFIAQRGFHIVGCVGEELRKWQVNVGASSARFVELPRKIGHERERIGLRREDLVDSLNWHADLLIAELLTNQGGQGFRRTGRCLCVFSRCQGRVERGSITL
jgi:hypothetical protein